MGKKWRVAWLVLVLSLLTGCDGQIESTNLTVWEKTEPTRAPTPLTFPVAQTDSALVAEGVQLYSGPYWEDGSGETVEGVAGLMLYNPTENMLEFAAFSVEQAGEQLYFFVYRLPPKSRCLVLEYRRKTCDMESITAYRELCVRWGTQEMSRAQIDYVGLGPKLTVINRDDRQIEHVTVWYKQYMKTEDYYLGGAAYSAHLFYVQPQERRTVTPEHYEAGYARIVGIEAEV